VARERRPRDRGAGRSGRCRRTTSGPDGVARTRTGVVARSVEPYENGVVLPHERTHRGPKEGGSAPARDADAARADLPPVRGTGPVRRSRPAPELEVEGARLWRLEDDGLGEAFADRRLLIADGHHRYETALAYHEEVEPRQRYMMVVLVSLEDPGLTIFPTHRVFRERRRAARGESATIRVRAPELEELERGRPRSSSTTGARAAVDGAGELDVQLVDRLGQEG
jgi:hypothetical protein